MLADVGFELVRPSRRWWLVVSLAVHAAVIAGVVVHARYPLVRLDGQRPRISITLLPPPPADRGECLVWQRDGDVAGCAVWRRPTHELVGCRASPALREPAPVVGTILPRDALVLRSDPPRIAGLAHAMSVDEVRGVRAVLEVCVAPDGVAIWAMPVASTGYPCIDEALALAMRHARFQPVGVPACGEITLRY